jgi:NAD(P)-dependent dehydrogenase (short-subunit alcohol dehydrogenase family)
MTQSAIRNYREVKTRRAAGSLEGSRVEGAATPARRLQGKVALVTGADGDIGRNMAAAFACEGAHVAVAYHRNAVNAAVARREIERQGCRCITLGGDPADEQFCGYAISETVRIFGQLDILANNVIVGYSPVWLASTGAEQMEYAFRGGFAALFGMTRAAQVHVKDPNAIVNTLSVVINGEQPDGMRWPAEKSPSMFVQSLARSLASAGLPVNAVALQADCEPQTGRSNPTAGATFAPAEQVVLSYVFVLSGDGLSMTGQMLRLNG